MTRALVFFLTVFSAVASAHAFAGGESAVTTHGAMRASTNDTAARGRADHSALARADKLLAELARLDDAASFAATTDRARRAARQASEIYARAQVLPASDLRIDLSTAARLYERAFARRLAPTVGDAATASCADERPGAYRALCARQSPRDAVALLIGKARRHADWARASVAEGRGEAVAQDAALAEMRAERILDAVVARQALDALAQLEAVTNAPQTLADYEEEKKIGEVSAADFGARLNASAQIVRRALAWLPESQLKTEIDNAWQSYTDALWWWERAERGWVVRVAHDKLGGQNFAAMSHVADVQLGYNAIVNLRQARRYTRCAEAIVAAELRRTGFETESR